MTFIVHSIVIICFKFLFVDRLGPTATLKTQSSRGLLVAVSHEIFVRNHLNFDKNAKWAKKDVCLVCFFNFFETIVKQQLLQGSKFCDTELRYF